MHSISPYTIRCYNPDLKGVKQADKYSPLGRIGQFDTYNILKDYIESLLGKYQVIADPKQIYRFHKFKFDDATRQFHGWMQAGTYGTKTDIININTGKVDFKKAQDNAEMINHYVRFFIPKDLNEGVVLLHNHGNIGIKTLLYEILRVRFNLITKRVLQMNPLAYEKAFKEWQDASARELKLIKFKGMANIEDQIARLGHNEQELIIKSTRKNKLGTLVDYFTPGSEQFAAVEVLTPLCSEIKTVVEIGGKKRTFKVGANPNHQVCEIEVGEKEVPMIAGSPDATSLSRWCKGLLNEFTTTIYPGMGVKL